MWNVKLIHIIAPAVLESDVNISKLFIASVPWFMKQCMQCLQTTRKTAGCWKTAVRTTENVLTHADPHISIDDTLMAALLCSSSVLQRACI